MTTTDNLELELVSGTETFDTDKVMNNFTKIDTAVGNLQDGVGNVESLTTTAKTDLVAAINEVDGNIGDLSGLSTTAKENLVSAVNELNQNMLRISVFNMTLKYSSANVLMASVNHSLGVTPKACIAQISSSDGSLRAFGYALSAEATSSRIIGYAYSASNWNSGDTVDVKVTAFYYKP